MKNEMKSSKKSSTFYEVFKKNSASKSLSKLGVFPSEDDAKKYLRQFFDYFMDGELYMIKEKTYHKKSYEEQSRTEKEAV